jgi:large repetitive protein
MKRKTFISFLLTAIMFINILCPMTVLAKSTVAVKSISLSKTSITLNINNIYTLKATISPSNATTKTVTWSSSNKAIASVSNGKITAHKAGTCTITAKSNNGKKATCKVKVNPSPTIKLISSVKVTTVAGKAPALPTTVTATMSDKTTEKVAVTWGAITKSKYASAGTFTVNGTISSSSIKATATVTVTPAVTVQSISPVSVTTTAGKAPTLPSTVTVTMSDKTTKSVAVTWASINSSSYANAGTFTVSGTISSSSIKATATVTVTSAVQSINPVNVTATLGTAPTLPSTVTAKMSDGTTKSVAVTWDYIYPAQYANIGSFTVSGAISSSSIKATATVTVAPAVMVQSISPVSIITKAGTAPDLPATVVATLIDGTSKNVAVTWDYIYPSQYASTGTFTVSGSISSSSAIKATVIVTVTASSTSATVQSINLINIVTMAGTAPTLPSTVTAAMSDGTSKNIAVIWDTVYSYQYTSAGTFMVSGSVSTSSTVKAVALVTVASYSSSTTVQSANPVIATTTAGIAPDLPSTVIATMGDGTTKNVLVTWNSISSSQYASNGTFTVTGTILTSSTIKAVAIVTVTTSSTSFTVRSINVVNVTTTAGTAPTLPTTVTAVMSDGTAKSIAVTWDYIYSSQYASAGAFSVNGTISSPSSIRAVAIVTVTGSSASTIVQTINNVIVTTIVGTAPDLPSTVTATMSDGTTVNIGVAWDYINPSKYAGAGAFAINGTISSSSSIKAVAVITVITSNASTTVKSISPVSVTAKTGTIPNLPSTVTATMSDGTTKNVTVAWDYIYPSQYASTGTFTIGGTISLSSSIRATAIITVK